MAFNKKGLALTLAAILLVALGFDLGLGYKYLNESGQINSTRTDLSNYTDCANLSLNETSYCLRDYVNTFYNYQSREDTKKTIEDIKQNGGDCYDYNRLYEDMAKELGFNAYSFRIESENKAHRIAVIMDDSGYCKLDMIENPDCVKFEN
jgi:hypothetical protein